MSNTKEQPEIIQCVQCRRRFRATEGRGTCNECYSEFLQFSEW